MKIKDGAWGSVSIIKIDDKDYAIKTIKFEKYDKETFDEETTIYKAVSKKNISPKFINSFVLEEDDDIAKGCIISELWECDITEKKTLGLAILDRLHDKINDMHNLGYYHFDILPKNILVKHKQKGKKKFIDDIALTDFGTSVPINGACQDWINIIYNYLKENPFKKIFEKHSEQDFKNNPKLLDYVFIYDKYYDLAESYIKNGKESNLLKNGKHVEFKKKVIKHCKK